MVARIYYIFLLILRSSRFTESFCPGKSFKRKTDPMQSTMNALATLLALIPAAVIVAGLAKECLELQDMLINVSKCVLTNDVQ